MIWPIPKPSNETIPASSSPNPTFLMILRLIAIALLFMTVTVAGLS